MKNSGITLIALLASIIIMVIIAGVAISIGTRGESSILSKTEETEYKNSITQIEQELNEFYVNHYDELSIGEAENKTDKAFALINYFCKHKDEYNWKDKANNSDNVFHKCAVDNSDSNAAAWIKTIEYTSKYDVRTFYVLNWKNINCVFNSKVLNMNSDYSAPRFVYGVTPDLRVFIFQNDLTDMIGMTCDELKGVEADTIWFDEGSSWAKQLNEGKAMTFEDIKSVKELTIKSGSHVTKLDAIDGLSSLEKFTVYANGSINSLEGIENSKNSLKELWIYGNATSTTAKTYLGNIKSYEGLGECSNLETIYMINITDAQLDYICESLSKGDLPKLKTILITDYYVKTVTPSWTSNWYYNRSYSLNCLTTLEPLKKLTQITQESVENLAFTNCSIEGDLTALQGFINLKNIKGDGNKITSLNGLQNHNKLQYLNMPINDIKNLDNVSKISTSLKRLDVRGNPNLNNIADVANINSLTQLWFTSKASENKNDSDVNLNENNIKSCRQYLLKLKDGLQIDPKYGKYLVDYSNTDTLQVSGEMTWSEFYELSSCGTKMLRFSIDNLKLVKDTVKDSSGKVITTENDLINKTLSKFTEMKYLQIVGMNGLESLSFLDSMNKTLIEFDIRKCPNIKITDRNSTDISKNEYLRLNNVLYLRKLAIDDTRINLTKIQTTLNRLAGSSSNSVDKNGNTVKNSSGATVTQTNYYWSASFGLALCDVNLYDQLPNCTDVTRLYLGLNWYGIIAKDAVSKSLDLTRLTKLTTYYTYGFKGNVILPSSVTYINVINFNHNNSYPNSGLLDVSRCNKLTYLKIDNSSITAMQYILNNLPENNTLATFEIYSMTSWSTGQDLKNLERCKGLTTLNLNGSTHNMTGLKSLAGIENITSLKNLTATYVLNLSEIPDLSKLTNLEKISITHCALPEISASTNINTLNNLKTIDVSYNNISNISGLITDKTDSKLTKLSTINLANNCLYPTSAYVNGSSETYYLTDRIFIPLYFKSLRTLNLLNNINYDDENEINKLKNYKWTKLSI